MILHDDDSKPQERQRAAEIQKLLTGVPVIITGPLPTDVVFYGVDNGGVPAMIGVEVKKPQDMADSAVRSGRLVQQFRNAQDFGCTHLFVVFQGKIRADPRTGLLQELRWDGATRKMCWTTVDNPQCTYGQLDNFLNTLMIQGGILVKRTDDIAETARAIVDLYHWWQRAPEEHQSLDRFHQPVFLGGQVPLFRRVIKEADGVGWTRSLDFLNFFADKGLTVPEILSLPAAEFKKVKGIGPVIAKQVEADMHRPVAFERGLEKTRA